MDLNGDKMAVKYPVKQALATAIYAFELNQKRVERDPIRATDTEPAVVPNRIVIANCLHDNITPSQEHLDQVEDLITYLQQTSIMQTLTGKNADRFLGSIVDLLSQETITNRDFGILSWAPKLANDYRRKDQIREVSSHYERLSRYVGKVGEKITVNFTLIERRYLTAMNSYAVYGHDDNSNLIFYWANNPDKIIEKGTIVGRVKKHNEDDYRNRARVTTLNYVKAVK